MRFGKYVWFIRFQDDTFAAAFTNPAEVAGWLKKIEDPFDRSQFSVHRVRGFHPREIQGYPVSWSAQDFLEQPHDNIEGPRPLTDDT
jgi:hypothetical protein